MSCHAVNKKKKKESVHFSEKNNISKMPFLHLAVLKKEAIIKDN